MEILSVSPIRIVKVTKGDLENLPIVKKRIEIYNSINPYSTGGLAILPNSPSQIDKKICILDQPNELLEVMYPDFIDVKCDTKGVIFSLPENEDKKLSFSNNVYISELKFKVELENEVSEIFPAPANMELISDVMASKGLVEYSYIPCESGAIKVSAKNQIVTKEVSIASSPKYVNFIEGKAVNLPQYIKFTTMDEVERNIPILIEFSNNNCKVKLRQACPELVGIKLSGYTASKYQNSNLGSQIFSIMTISYSDILINALNEASNTTIQPEWLSQLAGLTVDQISDNDGSQIRLVETGIADEYEFRIKELYSPVCTTFNNSVPIADLDGVKFTEIRAKIYISEIDQISSKIKNDRKMCQAKLDIPNIRVLTNIKGPDDNLLVSMFDTSAIPQPILDNEYNAGIYYSLMHDFVSEYINPRLNIVDYSVEYWRYQINRANKWITYTICLKL